MLQLLDLGCQHCCFCADNENQGRNRHHGIDKIIAEHLQYRAFGIGNDHSSNCFEPAVPHQHCRCFIGGIQLSQCVLRHHIRCGEEMNHITENNDPEGALQRCAAKCEQEGNTDDHSRYGISYTADGISTFSAQYRKRAACGHKSRAIRNHGTTSRCAQGYNQ